MEDIQYAEEMKRDDIKKKLKKVEPASDSEKNKPKER